MKVQLQQACELTQQIMNLLQADDFSQIEEKEAERQALIQQIFSSDKHLIDKEWAEKLLELNKQTELLLLDKRQAVMQQQIQMQKGKRIVSAYSQNQ